MGAKKPPSASSLQTITYQIIPVLKQEGVLKSSLFGSFAKGTETPESDLDILVELPEGKTLFDLVGLKIKLEEQTGRKVDIMTYASISPYLKNIISREEVCFYGKGS